MKTILRKVPDEDTYYRFEDEVEIDTERIIIYGNHDFREFGDSILLSIVSGNYYDDEFGYEYDIFEELEKYTGKKWKQTTIKGYSQGDWQDVYYVDGSTPTDIRDYYKSQCENDDTGNTVLVASIGTFGEGIDLCNIWSIFLVNSAKSERLVRQICGRGLRQYPGKDKTLLFDFVDDLRFTMDGRYEDNYMWKHYKERKKIYKEQNFPTYE